MSLVVQHIKSQLTQLGGWTVTEDQFNASTPLGPRQFVNVVALFDGDGGGDSGRLTLACHYDSKRFDSMWFIGASDSAAACAIMIQLARCLNASLHSALNDTARTSPVSSLEPSPYVRPDTDARYTRAVFVKFHWGGVEVLAIEVDDRANA